MKKYLKAIVEIKAENEFDVVASTDAIDRDGESIDPKGWELNNFQKNPVILWAHNYNELPIGVAEKVFIDDEKGLVVSGRFASEEANPKAGQVKRLYEENILRAVSVGFIPKERNGTLITKAELLEVSFVPVPSNPQALALAVAKGVDISILKARHEVCDPTSSEYDPDKCEEMMKEEEEKDDGKGVVANHEPPMADKERDWDADAAEGRIRRWASSDGSGDKETIDFAKYRTAFAWFSSDDPENFTSYKLPHCDIVDGTFSVVWRGVVASMVVLLGGRGGVDIPDADKKGVYNHLANHYKQFETEPPEFAVRSEGKQERPATEVQTVILSKDEFPTREEAESWIRDHDFHAEKVDETENSWRFRQFEPGECQGDSFRTIELTEGVSAVICRPKEGRSCGLKIYAHEEKAGRVISAKNREMISGSINSMKQSIAVLEKLLEATEPPPKEDGKNLAGGQERSQTESGLYEMPAVVLQLLQEMQARSRVADKQNEQLNSLAKKAISELLKAQSKNS